MFRHSESEGQQPCYGFLGPFREGEVVLLDAEKGISLKLLHTCAFRTVAEQEGLCLWIDGGNSFNPYSISELAFKCGYNVDSMLSRIRTARAFTAHQMHALSLSAEKEMSEDVDLIVISSVEGLFVGDVSWKEGRELLDSTLLNIKRLAVRAACPALITLDAGNENNSVFTDVLSAYYDTVIRVSSENNRMEMISENGFSSGELRTVYQRSIFEFL